VLVAKQFADNGEKLLTRKVWLLGFKQIWIGVDEIDPESRGVSLWLGSRQRKLALKTNAWLARTLERNAMQVNPRQSF
jgi:hypothetical protein